MTVEIVRDPTTQFQIGDPVIYLPAGVLTTIAGYHWHESMGGHPKIVLYKLACGISVPESMIRKRAVGDTVTAPAP